MRFHHRIAASLHTVRKAIDLFSRGRVGFADCLTAGSARAAGYIGTVTLDRMAARNAGMALPA